MSYAMVPLKCGRCGQTWREMTDAEGALTWRQARCPYCELAERAK